MHSVAFRLRGARWTARVSAANPASQKWGRVVTRGFSLILGVLLAEYGGDAERMAADAGTSVRTAEERVWTQLREAQDENADARRRMAARRGGAAAGGCAGVGRGEDTPDRPVGRLDDPAAVPLTPRKGR